LEGDCVYFLTIPPYDVLEGCSFPGLLSVPQIIGDIVKTIYMAIRVGVPVILLLAGMIDLLRAITSQKEDDIRKAQSLLFQKIMVAVIIFAFFTLVQFFINIVDQGNIHSVETTVDANGKEHVVRTNSNMWGCINALLGRE
jgi:hypothetical protein